MTAVTTYYLEMREPPSWLDSMHSAPYRLMECVKPQPKFNAFLYGLIGADWEWTDRLVWSDEQWRALVHADNHRTFVAYSDGVIAGYFELHKEGESVELLYFGLSPEFIGQGIGKALLGDAIKQAWDWKPVQRVWVHTCTLDHPAALANYQKRGFALYKTEVE